MPRFAVLSDLHLEFDRLGPIALEGQVDAVLCAGDVHPGPEMANWISGVFPGHRVVVVPGNHDYYGGNIESLERTWEELTRGTNTTVLQRSTVSIGGVDVVGCTLWTDLMWGVDVDDPDAVRDACERAERGLSDFRLIRHGVWNDVIRAHDVVDMHGRDVRWLRETLSGREGRPTVILTHHAPSGAAQHPRFVSSGMNHCFQSDLDDLIVEASTRMGPGNLTWVFGHTHHDVDTTVGGARLLSSQRGYPNEKTWNVVYLEVAE